MRLCYGILAIVAALMLPSVARGLACNLSGNIEASCVPLNECRTWQGFPSKTFVTRRELTAFTSAVRACQNDETIVCCAGKNVIKKKAKVAPECLQDRLGERYRHNGTYPNPSSFIAYIDCRLVVDENLATVCSASLITSKHLLTAAHCVMDVRNCYVYIGATNLVFTHDDGNYPDGTDYDVEENSIIIHEDYNGTSNVHDIALLLLKEPVDFSLPNSPRPVCIPSAKHFEAYLSEHRTLRTFGWGQNIDGITTQIKQVVYLQHVSLDYCRKEMNEMMKKHNFAIDERIICTHSVSGHNAFKGFSGSPLLYRQTQVWFVVGVVSYGIDVNNRSSNMYPFISTSIAREGDWIVEKINHYETLTDGSTQ